MSLVGRHNIASMKSATTGTGTLTLSSATPGGNTFANAGVANGERVTYTIRDGANTEVGRGTYTASGTTLSRDTVLSSTSGGSKINCSGRETVSITYAAEDIQPFASYYTDNADTVADATDNHAITLDIEWVDQAALASLSSNAVIVTLKGWYWCAANVYFSAATAFDGFIKVDFDGYINIKGYASAMGIEEDAIYIGPFMYNIPADATTIGPITISNHLGVSIDVLINDLTIYKIGNQ